MSGHPVICPGCGASVKVPAGKCSSCGAVFGGPDKARKPLTRDDKIRLKKLHKKKELLELYRNDMITEQQFVKGMSKLGYSTDVEKVLAFKKFIKEQIRAFEKLDVSSANEGGYHFDPNESKAELPRDEFGNVITDFSVSPRPAGAHAAVAVHSRPSMVSANPPPITGSGRGPVFGDTLFDGTRPSRRKEVREEVPVGKLRREVTAGAARSTRRRRGGLDLEWDEDEEEEEEFEVDLSRAHKGWWDDEDWELDWDDEDEEDWEDWDLEEDEEEEEWEIWEDRIEGGGSGPGVRVEFEDDDDAEKEEEDNDDGEEVFDPKTYYWGEDKEEEEDGDEAPDEEEEEDDGEDWVDMRPRRRRGY
ncbi:MAG: hypothetical protein ACMUHY_07205 [Thermoplasmatota archaeon]